jgi:maleylpyruvate isomerase
MDDRVNERALDEVAAAEERLVATVRALDDAALAGPSLLPGWTRGHVLAHVALNGHSLVNLFEWARTGVVTPQYPSWAERDADIERHAARSRAEHLTALETAASAFRTAARAVPEDRWSYEVSGIGGDPVPAERFLFGRLREVEIHHVDLDAGYAPADWDDAFVRRVLDEVPARLSGGVDEPFAAHATDLGVRVEVGAGRARREVSGRGGALLAWLLGRSDGADLDAGRAALPRVPAWG